MIVRTALAFFLPTPKQLFAVSTKGRLDKPEHWLDGRVVMQRTATPCTPVRFRLQPPFSGSQTPPGGEIGRHKGLKIHRIVRYLVGCRDAVSPIVPP